MLSRYYAWRHYLIRDHLMTICMAKPYLVGYTGVLHLPIQLGVDESGTNFAITIDMLSRQDFHVLRYKIWRN